jgi:UDP-N-acetylglucosamine 1-carboxyvinyltransferase
MGAGIEIHEGFIYAEAQNGRLTGTQIYLDLVSVGATINIMLAAARAAGSTVIYNAAKEPHIVDLANFLNSMGARIKGAGTDVIRISGRQALHGTTYTVIPDQIETGTLMIAAAATRGDVTIRGCIPTHMESLTAKLLEMGVRVTENDDSIRVRPQYEQRAVNVKTQVYPGFPTDLQQPMTALLCMANGTSTVCETIFEQRFKHLDELRRMGAHVRLVDRTVLVDGVHELFGAPVTVTDLRAGAALIVAGLMAKGMTEIYETSYIDRGYERIEEKLRSLGADIRREKL